MGTGTIVPVPFMSVPFGARYGGTCPLWCQVRWYLSPLQPSAVEPYDLCGHVVRHIGDSVDEISGFGC